MNDDVDRLRWIGRYVHGLTHQQRVDIAAAADVTEALRQDRRDLLAEIERLRGYCDLAAKYRADNWRLRAALRDLIENVGGHNHWDAQGTHGANCSLCTQQWEAKERARAALKRKP